MWSANNSTSLSTANDTVIGSVTVQTPTSGYVTVSASGYVNEVGDAIARCSITTGTTIDNNALNVVETSSTIRFTDMSAMRTYTINYGLFPSPTSEKTYNLVCDSTAGTPNLLDPQLSATFVPDPDAFSTLVFPFPDEAPSDPFEDGIVD